MLVDILRRAILKKKEPFLFRRYQENMIKINTNETGLYLHVPFCKSLCPYCPYNKVLYKEELLEPYKKALIAELKLYKELNKNLSFTSLYVGGGTPSLYIRELKEIIEFLKLEFSFEGDIGIELHPSTVTEENLSLIKEAGINMVSLGVQTFSKQHLSFLGRNYDGEYIDKVLRLISEYEFECVDIDIMTSLPDQTIEDIERDLHKVFTYDIHQLSIYPLIVFPMTALHNEIKRHHKGRLNELQEYRVLQLINDIAEKNDFERTSIWTYGKRDTKRYTSVTRESFIGIGAGASSRVEEYFYTNTFDINEYISSLNHGILPINLVNLMEKREQMIFWIFWRCYDGRIDSESFKAIFERDMETEFRLLFKLMRLAGVVYKTENSYTLTKWGGYLYHLVEKRYSISYLNKLWQRSMESPWIEELTL